MMKPKVEEAITVAQAFIWHLHDETRWPAKYYKDVLYFLFDVLEGKTTVDESPESIHYSKCCEEYAKPTLVVEWPPQIKGFYTSEGHYFCSKCNKLVGFPRPHFHGIWTWEREKLVLVKSHSCRGLDK